MQKFPTFQGFVEQKAKNNLVENTLSAGGANSLQIKVINQMKLMTKGNNYITGLLSTFEAEPDVLHDFQLTVINVVKHNPELESDLAELVTEILRKFVKTHPDVHLPMAGHSQLYNQFGTQPTQKPSTNKHVAALRAQAAANAARRS